MIPILMECSYSLLNAWAAQCSMLMFLWLTGLRTVCSLICSHWATFVLFAQRTRDVPKCVYSLSYFCSLSSPLCICSLMTNVFSLSYLCSLCSEDCSCSLLCTQGCPVLIVPVRHVSLSLLHATWTSCCWWESCCSSPCSHCCSWVFPFSRNCTPPCWSGCSGTGPPPPAPQLC